MSDNETTLLRMIQESGDPEQALQIAIRVLSAFLEQFEEAPAPLPAALAESS